MQRRGTVSLPSGRYISLNYSLRALTGGQTRATLMRNRMFAEQSGIEPMLTTLDAAPVYDRVREQLMDQGQLVAPMQLLNLYEFYRHHPAIVVPREGVLAPAPEVELNGFDELDRVEELHPDGTLYTTMYFDRIHQRMCVQDLHRPDGSVYLRRPIGSTAVKKPMSPYQLVDADGKVVASWGRERGLHKFWLRQLAGDAERIFLISDCRFALRTVIPIADRRFHVLHLMHNIHLAGSGGGGTRLWNASLTSEYAPLLNSIADLDGLVSLTDRQREDVAQRCGRTNNLFVVPNPVELPTPPEAVPSRDPMKIIVVSRLEPQKNLEAAVRAFALVLKQVPQARLDIYGKGSQKDTLTRLIDELEVGHAVTVCGYHPDARDQNWTATALVMSSRNEGYPLASLEAMVRGCPVVSYDVKYGPREQITEGVDGFLVEPGDIDGLAERMVRILHDPALAERMSRAALIKGRGHGRETFLIAWKGVLEQVVQNKPERTRLDGVEFELTECGYVAGQPTRVGISPWRPRSRRNSGDEAAPLSTSASFDRSPTFQISGSLRIVGKGRPTTFDAAVVSLEAVCDESAAVVSLPLEVTRRKRRFRFHSSFDVATVFAELGEGRHAVRLRLRLVWSNSSWETNLGRPVPADAPFEVSFATDGQCLLHGGTVVSP